MQEETKYQYVVRKLNDKSINLAKVCRDLEISRSSGNRIKNGGKSRPAMISVFHDYFKKLGD